MTAHKNPVAPVPTAGRPLTAVGTNPIGAELPSHVARPSPTGEAGAPNLSTPTMPCRECDGKGEAEYMGLCDRYYRVLTCHSCFGSGVEPLRCGTCEDSLTATGFCMACDDFESGWLLAERSALGMVKP